MKRLILIFLFCFVLCNGNIFAQVFWTEDFGSGCSQNNLVSSYTGTNGAWTLTATGTNGTKANNWFVSATEAGMTAGSCGDGCLNNSGLTNRSLHVGCLPIILFCPSGDCGAAYNAGGNAVTDRRAESPVINCSGRSNITLTFIYMEEGEGTSDNATVWYYDGSTWAQLSDPAKSNNSLCYPQGTWTAYTISLPASANNNAAVKIGFRWVNNGNNVGTDPSCAIDNVSLSSTSSVPPDARFTVNDSTLCAGQCVSFTDQSINGPTSWAWTFTGANPTSSTAQNPTNICYNTAGNYNVRLIVSNGSQTDTLTKTAYIAVTASQPAVVVPSNPVICNGNSVQLAASGGTGFSWSPVTGLSNPGIYNPTANPSTNTTYVVTITNGGCSATASASVTVITAPGSCSPITGPAFVCQGTPSSQYSTGATNATSYLWTLSPAGAGSISGTGATGSVSWNTGYSGSAVISVASVNACDTTTPVTLNVTIGLSAGTSSPIHGPTVLCQGTTSTGYTEVTTNATNYEWTLSPSGAGVVTGTGTNGTVYWAPTFSGTATLSVIPSNACDTAAAVTLIITINPLPVIPSVPAGNLTICPGDTISPYTTGSNFALGFIWTMIPDTAGVMTITNDSVSIDWNPNYFGQVDICVSSYNACDTTVASCTNVVIVPGAHASFGYLVNNGTVTFSNYSVNSNSFSWFFGDNSNSTDANPVHIYAAPGSYTVELIAFNQCGSDTAIQVVQIITTGIDETTRQNAFTIHPNPFSEKTTLDYMLTNNENITLEIFDITGKRVATLLDNKMQSVGNHSIEIELRPELKGIFLLKATHGSTQSVYKLVKI
jgi:PKD repeat protein